MIQIQKISSISDSVIQYIIIQYSCDATRSVIYHNSYLSYSDLRCNVSNCNKMNYEVSLALILDSL